MLLTGKTGVVMGVSNKYGFAWAIARAAAQHGARVAITYQDERLGRRASELLELEPGVVLGLECDVSRDEAIERTFAEIGERFGAIDFLVHSIAFARREELQGEFVDTSRDGFALAHDVSVYSLVAAARAARPLLAQRGGSIVTLTFEGSQRVFPNYNVMGVAKAALEATVRYLANDLGPQGIRVNAISAGPVKTLASSAVKGISQIEEVVEQRAPLRRNITTADAAGVAVFLASDLAAAVTGEIIHVDSGYHIMGF